MIYDIGDQVTLAVTFTDDSDVATDPTTVTLTVREPSGAETDVTPTNTATGCYTATWDIAMNGRHVVTWTGTGTIDAVSVGYFLAADHATELAAGLTPNGVQSWSSAV